MRSSECSCESVAGKVTPVTSRVKRGFLYMAIRRPSAECVMWKKIQLHKIKGQVTAIRNVRNEEKLITNSNYSKKVCNRKGLKVICNYVIKNNQKNKK